VANPRYKPVAPDQVIRELRKEFRRLETKEDPGPARAAMLASFTRAAHSERELNMAMHTASLSIAEDPEPPALLIGAYITSELTDPEERLRVFTDLDDLARYVDNEELRRFVKSHIHDESRAWVLDSSDQERKHRLRTLTSIFSQKFADAIRDEAEFL
jgi:hypothetical protein